MAKYTIELRKICESVLGHKRLSEYPTTEEVITESAPLIFNFSYPIFDESYKSVLETKIIRHYFTREIGLETKGLFEHFLCMKMNEIMPYYNQLYQSALLEVQPFNDVDYTRTHSGKGTSTGNNTSNRTYTEQNNDRRNHTGTTTRNIQTTNFGKSEETGSADELNTIKSQNSGSDQNMSTSKNTSKTTTSEKGESSSTDKYSDTPQGGLTGISSNTYLTNVRLINGDSSSSGTGTQTDDGTTQTTTTYGSQNATENVGKTTTKSNGQTTGTGSHAEEAHDTTSDTGIADRNGNDSTNATNTANTTDDWLERVVGKTSSMSYSELLLKYRETFLNIDLMVIKELETLFFGLWE